MIVTHIAAITVLTFGLAVHGNAGELAPKPCAAAELKAARNSTPTRAQLKDYVDATVEIYRVAQRDKAVADALSSTKESANYSCRMDDNTTVLGFDGAQKIISQYPQIAKIYSSHNITARELGLWSVIVVQLALSIDPQFGAFAKEALSSQQAAFAKQHAEELRRLMKAIPR